MNLNMYDEYYSKINSFYPQYFIFSSFVKIRVGGFEKYEFYEQWP